MTKEEIILAREVYGQCLKHAEAENADLLTLPMTLGRQVNKALATLPGLAGNPTRRSDLGNELEAKKRIEIEIEFFRRRLNNLRRAAKKRPKRHRRLTTDEIDSVVKPLVRMTGWSYETAWHVLNGSHQDRRRLALVRRLETPEEWADWLAERTCQ